jgi:signal transduction histidine kinase
LVVGSYQGARDRAVIAGVALGAVVITAMAWGPTALQFAYPFPGGATMAAALTSASALTVCVIFWMRHRHSRRRTDLLLSAIFGFVAIVEGVLPVIAQVDANAADFSFWSRVIARTLVALGLCVTAWLPERRHARRAFGAIVVGAGALMAATLGWTLAITSDLPTTVNDATDAGSALMTDSPVLGVRLAGMALLLVASVGFVRKARRGHDPVLVWVAGGAILLATARGHDFLFPSLHNDWLTTGDTLRLFGEWVILFGLLREVAGLWRQRGAEARAQERRAMAAELHDGLAQELAYLTVQTALAERDPDNRLRLARVRQAAERALSETRLRIDQYGHGGSNTLDAVIRRVAADVESRYGCGIVLELERIAVPSRTAHELARVAGEALVNAVRHGDPEKIVVRLSAHGGRIRLTVTDDGVGIEGTASDGPAGYGLTAMRQRAARLGGGCRVEPGPRGGTRVSVEVPAA